MRALLTAYLLVLPASAHAHLGHVGEIAGHSHWVAVGAGITAAALAALLAKARGRGRQEDAKDAENGAEPEGEAESHAA